MSRGLWRRILKNLYSYFIFFLLVAFLVTCTTMLFVSVMTDDLNLELNDENIRAAAKLTFLNVIILSVLISLIDYIRRKLTTDKITKKITEAAKRYVEGDFSVRIKKLASFGSDENLNTIIDCLNTMAEELSGVETLRTDFVSNVSHEMKTPLTVMQNYARLLASDSVSEAERKEYAACIQRASKRLSDMMTNVLKLNRLENQKIYPTPTRFNLSELLLECLLSFESAFDEKEIELDVNVEEGVYICADSELLSLVFNNLISNALKFTERVGKVWLSLRSEGGIKEIEVRDNGCGMSAEVGAHIFEKFYQGDTSHSTEGNGLGLALVKRVVDIIGAEISVSSKLSEGSTFTVRLRGDEE